MTIREFQDLANNRVTLFDAIQTKECSWGPDKWLIAIVGEVGELARYLKEVERHDLTFEEALPHIMKETVDVVSYCFAMMSCLGGDMENEILSKFREVSKRWIKRAESNGQYDLANALRDQIGLPRPCYHFRSQMAVAVIRDGAHVRGCDPAGTYYLYKCECGAEVWDNEFKPDPPKRKK